MNSAIKTAAKLAIAGTTIAGIGFAMVTFGGTKTPVKEAEADILALDFAPKSKSEKFVDSLKDLGMEKPRVYDWNGNTMYLSTMVTNRTPTEVLRDFQGKFVENGVNRAAHTTPVVPADVPTIGARRGCRAQAHADAYCPYGARPVRPARSRRPSTYP